MGTGWGVPFGPYSYTSLLGPKWFDLVPLLIPLSWFTMGWACWTLARQHRSGTAAVLLATVLLVSWDLLLDPAMSKVTSYWVWGEAGSYYGMPWMNLFGWGVTGLVLFLILNQMAVQPAHDGVICHGGIRYQFRVTVGILHSQSVLDCRRRRCRQLITWSVRLRSAMVCRRTSRFSSEKCRSAKNLSRFSTETAPCSLKSCAGRW